MRNVTFSIFQLKMHGPCVVGILLFSGFCFDLGSFLIPLAPYSSTD